MSRWEPDARARLERAALELFEERGYDRTTVADIAARAGLTERTFFRHFTDKREVLFAGGAVLGDLLAEAIAHAPAEMAPLDAVGAALAAFGETFESRRAYARVRHAVIGAHPDLQERELIKLAALASALAEALRRRGVREPAASLTAEAGVAVFKLGFARWVEPSNTDGIPEIIRALIDELASVTRR